MNQRKKGWKGHRLSDVSQMAWYWCVANGHTSERNGETVIKHDPMWMAITGFNVADRVKRFYTYKVK